jgi:protein-L-isoaspartate(D-aspartate) O-methyltransferase
MNLQNVEQARFNMIEQQIRPWNVGSEAVLGLMASIKREDFVPLAQKSLAFTDMAIALPGGQAMLAPRVQARLLQDAAIGPTDKVLEIGTGSGFMTALMAKQAQRVISLEINAEIATMARANLQRAGIHNVEVRQADGASGTLADAPFDVILLGGSVAEVPQSLLNMLKVGGHLIGIVGGEPVMHAQIITRTSNTNFTVTSQWEDTVPRLVNFPQPSAFKF